MAERDTFVSVNDGDQLNSGYFNGAHAVADGTLGEIKMFHLSITGSVTKAALQARGWAICDGTTPAAQGISSPTITTTPDLQDQFIRMSNDETSGSTGGSATQSYTVQNNTYTSIVSVDSGAGNNVVQEDSDATTDTKSILPPFTEMVLFIKAKII